MRLVFSSFVVWGSLFSVLAACGAASTGKEAESGLTVASLKTTPAPAKKGAAEPADAAPRDAGPSAPAAEAASEPAEERDAIRKASRPPLELLTAPNVVFIFNFTESDVGAAAKQTCDEQAPDDPRENRECLSKARSKVPVEFIRFVKEESGSFQWLTYNKYKGNLLKWHNIQFLPGEETADSIVLKPTGKDKGIAPMARVPRTLHIDLPNDYSIVVNDREHGKMVYDAKIGLMQPE